LLLLAAETEVALGEFDRAETMLKRIIASDDTSLPAYAALGRLYVAQNRLEPALAQFQRLALQDPTPASRTVVAQILSATGRRDEAKREYEQVLSRHPAAAVAANNLAWMYQEDGRLDEALRLALVARKRLDRAPEVADTLGWIHVRRGEFQQAIQPLSDAVQARPDNPLYRAHLGVTYWKAGDAAQAARELKIALASSESFSGRAEAEAALRQVETQQSPK
jgi:tetratricopeptide (TPR) repeat protein